MTQFSPVTKLTKMFNYSAFYANCMESYYKTYKNKVKNKNEVPKIVSVPSDKIINYNFTM